MSRRHPVIALTGSSGSGTSTAIRAFDDVFARLNIQAAKIQGDAFHRYNRVDMEAAIKRARIRGENFSHFGPTANHLRKLEALFREYGESGTGFTRRYLRAEDVEGTDLQAGTFTHWEPIDGNSDVLLYEGLHGAAVTDRVNVARHVDLLIGMTPTINLEWIQKIHRDTTERGYTAEDVSKVILRRMPDYVKHIVPQFSRTDVNLQRVPLVDTSNPFLAPEVPTDNESFFVISVARLERTEVDFEYILDKIPQAFMSRINTLVVPGAQMRQALGLVLDPLVRRLLKQRNSALTADPHLRMPSATSPENDTDHP